MFCLINSAILVSASQQANARFRVTEKTQYFVISGNTASELRNSLKRAHPDFNAETKWHVSTNYYTKPFGKICQTTRVDVTLDLVVLLPRVSTKLSPAVQRKWDHFIAAVVVHENGHVRLYKSAAMDLDKRLNSVTGPCGRIIRDADAVAHAGYKRMQKVNDDYDRETAGGTKQGASLY